MAKSPATTIIMEKFIVLTTLKHPENTTEGNEAIHSQVVEAQFYSEVELKVLMQWSKVGCECKILQITQYS